MAALAVLLALAAVPGSATAGETYLQKAERQVHMRLHGSGGYTILITARSRGTVSLTAWSGRSHRGVQYLVSAASSGSRIRAGLPGLGRIDVTLRPRGRERRMPPPFRCGGRGNLVRPAVARGTIRFRGEDGFTRVTATRARAQIVQRPRRRCAVEPELGEKGQETGLAAFSVGGKAFTAFFATKVPAEDGSRRARFEFVAVRLDVREELETIRWAWSRGGPGSLVFAHRKSRPEEVSVEPPPPFRGTAKLARTPESTLRWTGSLGVGLLGIADVRLTGRRFESELCFKGTCTSERGEGSFLSAFPERMASRWRP